MIDHLAAHLALRARLLTASGLPTARAWENKDFTPAGSTPYVADQYVPATTALVSFPAANGITEETGLYVVQWYGVANTGITAIREGVQAILAAFTPGTVMTLTTGDVLRVRADVGPMGGQILPAEGGWAVSTIKIPWRAWSTNVIAA